MSEGDAAGADGRRADDVEATGAEDVEEVDVLTTGASPRHIRRFSSAFFSKSGSDALCCRSASSNEAFNFEGDAAGRRDRRWAGFGGGALWPGSGDAGGEGVSGRRSEGWVGQEMLGKRR